MQGIVVAFESRVASLGLGRWEGSWPLVSCHSPSPILVRWPCGSRKNPGFEIKLNPVWISSSAILVGWEILEMTSSLPALVCSPVEGAWSAVPGFSCEFNEALYIMGHRIACLGHSWVYLTLSVFSNSWKSKIHKGQDVTEHQVELPESYSKFPGAIYFTYGNEEWEMRGRFKREGSYVNLWLILVDVWQKSTQKPAILLYNIVKELSSN